MFVVRVPFVEAELVFLLLVLSPTLGIGFESLVDTLGYVDPLMLHWWGSAFFLLLWFGTPFLPDWLAVYMVLV